MKNLNASKIYCLAIFQLVMPKVIKHRFRFRTTPIENLAIGTTMIKIKYWKSFIRKRKTNKKLIFTQQYPETFDIKKD
jgi:hypothetical protein